MPYTLKPNKLFAKDPNGDGYLPQNVVTDQSTAEQVALINLTGTAQVSAIQEKGAETLDSIPDDYTALQGEVDDLKSALNANKGELFGGEITPPFELGTIYLDDNWRYVNSDKRIRFPQGFTLRLQKGATIALSSYANAKLRVGWKIDGVIAGTSAWLESDFTTTVEAEYSIAVMSSPESSQSSPTALASLVIINNQSVPDKIDENRVYDTGNMISPSSILDGYINPAGWFVAPTAAGHKGTSFIPVSSNEKYVAYIRRAKMSDKNMGGVGFYTQAKDGNTAFIRRDVFAEPEEDGDNYYVFHEIIPPDNAQYMRVYYIPYGEQDYYLYNTTNKLPVGLAGLYGYYNSMSGSGNNQKSVVGADQELVLSTYEPINYNLENGRWAESQEYRSVLIPVDDLTFSTDFIADTYKCSFAYLKSNTITVGEKPDLCAGASVENIAAGNSVHRKVPEDCKYLYVYITTGNQFENYHVINKALKYDFDTVRQNAKGIVYISDVDQVLRAIKHRHDGNANTFTGTNWSDNLLVLAQITDVHSDPSSYSRFIAFLNRNTDTINAGIVSGDLVDHGADNQFSLMIGCESELSENATLIKCLGNHEMQSTKTQAETYAAYGLDTNTGKSYYYVDYATQKIRIICLDQYDTDSTDTNIKTKTAHYSQAQIDWLINTLKDSTTNEYAVIVVYHSCNEVGFPTYNDSGFCQDRKYSMFQSPTSGTIISDIIDAFQNGTSLSETYTASDIRSTLTVNTTFSSKGTFICYICGHEHIDYVGYSTKYPSQLICIAQGGVVDSQSRPETEAHWQSMYDTPRVVGTSTQDSFNVYGIDTVNRLVKIVKIGSTLTDKFVPRSFATFRF